METKRARAELERLKSAFRECGVEGVEWLPIAIDPSDHAAAVAETLLAAVDAGEAQRLQSLVGAVLDLCPWASMPRVSVYVQSAKRRAVLRADVLVFDPAETLASAPAKAALSGGAAPDPTAREVWRVLQEVVARAGGDATERFDHIREALSAANMAFGGDRAELLAQALKGLPPDAALLVGDMILLTRREGDHQRTREDLETLLENELHTPAGGLRGREFSHGAWAKPPRRPSGHPWGDDPKMGGGDELVDLAPVEANADRDLEIARLGAVVEDDEAVERTRLDALRALEAIDHREARAFRLRALGYSRLFLNAIHGAPLGDASSLFREIVLCRDDRRIAGALALLQHYGREGLDGAAIWSRSATHPVKAEEVRVASLYRHCVIERYAELADASVAKAIRAELPEHRDDPMWVRGAACAARDPGAEIYAASVEQADAVHAVAARLPELHLGTLRPAAGLKHSHPITGLAMNAQAEPLAVSCDSGGDVQISMVEYRAERRALVPLFREALHAPGRTVVAWASDTLLVSAGGDSLVKEIEVADPRAPRVRKEHRLEAPVTAIARGSRFAGRIVLGDAAGRVFALDPDSGAAPEQLARFRLGEIRRVLASPLDSLLVAVDVEGRAAVLDEKGPRLLDLSVPILPEAMAFLGSGILLAFGGGSGWHIDLRTGDLVSERPQQEAEPVVLRRGAGDRELRALARGNVSVSVGGGGGVEYAGSEPLALVDVAWERGVVVMATRAGWLRSTEFRG